MLCKTIEEAIADVFEVRGRFGITALCRDWQLDIDRSESRARAAGVLLADGDRAGAERMLNGIGYYIVPADFKRAVVVRGWYPVG
jgi:hypothetical protein